MLFEKCLPSQMMVKSVPSPVMKRLLRSFAKHEGSPSKRIT
jgi:hypothetical protein